MKKIFFTFLTVAGIVAAQAQGTLQFTVSLNGANQVPPNDSTATGSGTLSLSGTTLSYNFGGLWTFPVTTGSINGPVSPGSTAPVLFDLGAPSFAVPNPPDPGGYTFVGAINNLTTPQINDLLAGLWYANVYSTTYPGGEIRGQITAVPEPSAFALLGVGAALLVFVRRARKSGRKAGGSSLMRATVSAGLLLGLWTQIAANAFPVSPNDPINTQTNVYELPPGISAIANPLWHRRGTRLGDSQNDNRVVTLFPRVPHGTVLYKFDAHTQRFTVNRFGPRGWSRPAETLNPGEGALFFNPIRRLLRLSVTGDSWNFGLSVAVPEGFSLISFPGIIFDMPPLEPGVIPPYWWDSRFFHPQEGNVVFTLDRRGGAFVPHTFQDGQWDTVPVLSVTESFFVFTHVARVIENKDLLPL